MVDDVEEEGNGLCRLHGHDRPCLNPLRELVYGDKEMGVAPGCLLWGANHVQTPDHERPGDRDHLEFHQPVPMLSWGFGTRS